MVQLLFLRERWAILVIDNTKDEEIDDAKRCEIVEKYGDHDLIVWAMYDAEADQMGPDSDTHILLPHNDKRTLCGLDVPDADEFGVVGNTMCERCASLVSKG